MIPFLLIVGFWAEGKWIRPSVSVVTRDGSSGNSLVPVNWSKSLRMLGCTHIKRSLPGDPRSCFPEVLGQRCKETVVRGAGGAEH